MSAIATSYSGVTVDYEDIESTEIRGDDLRIHLTRLCRYNGAVEFSVLQHLALCALLAEKWGPVVKGYAAAHDLHEAYTGDLNGKIKRLPWLADLWLEFESRWAAHVHRSMGLPWPLPEQVQDMVDAIDHRALFVETFTCGGHENLVERLRQPQAVSAWEQDRANLVLGMRTPALWAVVSGAIRDARYALAQ